MNKFYKVALLCWALPLIAGSTVFAAWLGSRNDDWMFTGMYVIVGGAALFVVGVAALIISVFQDRRSGTVPSRRIWASGLACAGLLLSNFPVAVAMTISALRIETRYRVVVQNESESVWEDVQVFGGGTLSEAVDVSPGEETTLDVWPATDGVLQLRARSGSEELVTIIEEYAANGWGDHVVVTLHSDGTATVEHPHRSTQLDPLLD